MKKIICILLAVTMLTVYMPVMAATTTFSDVANNSSYKNAIYTLVDFGIILGDAGSDTFRPQANISREEFSVIMTRVLGLGALNVTVTEYPFPDVTPSTAADWSIKATKIAYDLGIIKGFEDGTFRPKESVTFEQAVKMIVCALGYDATALDQGGWPNGYITVARGLGVLDNAEAPQTQPASREIIAQLVANSLEVTLAGTAVEDKVNLLGEKLKYFAGTGVVTGIEGMGLKSNALSLKADEVQIGDELRFGIGDTSVKDFLGKQVKYYYKVDDGKNILVSARLTTKNSEVTINSDKIKELTATKLEYYPDLDNTAIYETLAFETEGLCAVHNGKYIPKIEKEEHTPNLGSIRLIDNNGNGVYDVVIIESTDVYVVSSVDTSKKRVYDSYVQGKYLELDGSTSQADVKITKANTEVDFNQIKKGDVLLVSESKASGGKRICNVEIVTNTVEGTVTAKNPVYGEVIISGKSYEYSPAYASYIATHSSEEMEVGSKATIYLDKNNKIIAATSTVITTNVKYGYLINAGAHKTEEYAQFKIYTTENTTVVLNGASKLKINGDVYPYDEIAGILEDTNDDTNKDEGAENADVSQLIKYTTNSSGQIDNIYTIQTLGDPQKKLILSKPYDVSKYTSSNRHFDSGVTLSTTTKVMFIPQNRKENDYSVGTYSKLKNGKDYAFEVYDASETNVPAIILVYGSPSTISVNDVATTFALVETVKETTKDGEIVYELKCKVDGKDETYYADDGDILDGYTKGDVLKVEFDAKGKIAKVVSAFEADKIPAEGSKFTYPEKENEKAAVKDEKTFARYVYNYDNTNNYKTVYGTVYARDDERMIVVPYDIKEVEVENADGKKDILYELENSPTYTVNIASSTKIYVLDTTVSSTSPNRFVEGTIDSIAGYMSANSGASTVYSYIKNNVTKFIIVVLR